MQLWWRRILVPGSKWHQADSQCDSGSYSPACIAIIHGTKGGKIEYNIQEKLCSCPVSPTPNRWRWLWRDEQAHMAVLGKETNTDMPVVTRRVASHGDTAASILEFVFLWLPVLISRDLNFFLPVSIIEALLFVATMPFTVRYKCLWWETELFLWLWLQNVVIPVWYTALFQQWRGAQVRVLEDSSHVTAI